MPSRAYKQIGFWVALALLAVSISSYKLIPPDRHWGVDLENIFTYHHCEARNNPYLSNAAACQDPGGNDMYYPPLLYWSFVWLRPLSFAQAIRIWDVMIVALLLPLAFVWARREEQRGVGTWETLLFWILLLIQFPVTFAMERGNNDVLVVFSWSLAALAYERKRMVAAGFALGISAALKLYPATACIVVAAGILAIAVRSRNGRVVAWMAAGGLAAAALAVGILHEQTARYFTDQLPRFMARLPGPSLYFSHSVPALTAPLPDLSRDIGIGLLVIWCIAAIREIERDPALIFAGALAISTYFAAISYDYNLMTTYPLFFVLFCRAVRDRSWGFRWTWWALLLLGLIAVVGHRSVLTTYPLIRLHVKLQLVWLAGVGIWALFRGCSAASPPRRELETPSAIEC
jgi:hypothetical protein